MREVNEAEVELEVMAEDRLDVATKNKVQISSTTVTRKDKAQQENVEEAIQAQGTINLKPDAITVRRLAKNKVEEETNYVEQEDEKFEIVILAHGGNEGSPNNTPFILFKYNN